MMLQHPIWWSSDNHTRRRPQREGREYCGGRQWETIQSEDFQPMKKVSDCVFKVSESSFQANIDGYNCRTKRVMMWTAMISVRGARHVEVRCGGGASRRGAAEVGSLEQTC